MTLSELVNNRISHKRWPKGMPFSYLSALYNVGLSKAANVFAGKEITRQQDLDAMAALVIDHCGPHMTVRPEFTCAQIVAYALYLTLNHDHKLVRRFRP